MAHNHPGGDPSPSQEDSDITKQLVDAGKLLGIEIRDHVIVSKTNFFSFAEHKLI
jgi:DNA repair protein RadC